MQFKGLAFFIISATILVTGCDSKNEEKEEIKKELIKKDEKNIKLTTQDAQTLTFEKTENAIVIKELAGKAVLLNFWATWCPPCKAEIPHLNNLKEKYKDKFEVVAVSLGERGGEVTPDDKMKDFIEQYKINYIVTNTKENLDVADAIGGIRSIPTMFLLSPTGEVVQKYVGVVPEEMLETDIKRVIGK